MEEPGSGNSSIPGPYTHTVSVALESDLNKTPAPSPLEEPAGGNDDGDHQRPLCRRPQPEMLLCSLCVKHFHVDHSHNTQHQINWKCAECSTECRRTNQLRRSASAVSAGTHLGLFDMNASPAREVGDDDVALSVNTEFAVADKMQDKCRIPLVGCTLTSPHTCPDMQIAQLNLDIATQNANLVYLQALKDYISEKEGVLDDGWHVKFKYSESICKTSPIYCAPDGSKFDSMQKVAHYFGLLSAANSFETNVYDRSLRLLENGSHAAKNMNYSSRSMSKVSNSGNAVEVDPFENDNCASEFFLDGFPVQFEDFFVTSIGKIDPQFHSASQIWPVGYKSIWHDKLTGSAFVCSVLSNGDCGLKFRVSRYPCTKLSTPIASTVIYKPKCRPSDQSSCSTTESKHLTSNNFLNGDLIGEFSVEGRSPSSAWQMVLETLLFACRQSFQDLKFLSFCCNHSVESEHFYGSYGVDSLDKFSYLTGQTNSIPSLIVTVDQLELSCMVLRRWLQLDRFGLDAEFVQELIEQLPEAFSCSEYKSLEARCQNSVSHTVGSGFFTVLRKYHSQPMVSDIITENEKRLSPPGNAIVSNIPPALVGNFLQAYEFFLRFHSVLGLETPLSRQKLEYELLNPWVDSLNLTTKVSDENFAEGTKESEYSCQSQLSNFHMAMVKMLVEDMLSNIVINDPYNAMESKSRKGKKKNMEVKVNEYGQKSKIGIFPINEFTWPELARRYILVFLSMDDKSEDLEVTSREFSEIFHCLNGNGGPLCGYLTGMAAIEADAVVLAEASKKVFSSVKTKAFDFIIEKDLNINDSAIEKKRTDNKCPGWIKVLEPIRKQPTNVGAKIRNRVKKSLEKGPPEWATQMLLKSISKDIYKGNAAGPTKKLVVEVLDKIRHENPLTKKKAKESRIIRTLSDVIMKRCRMVLRVVAAEGENKFFFNFMAESFLKLNEFDDVGNLEMVSRPLDFRTIDLRLDAGSYGDSHESFIADVREVVQNLRIKYRSNIKYLECIDRISKNIEEQYEERVLTLVNNMVKYWNGCNETRKELNMMIAETISTTLFVAPWEVGTCKICGKDENDHVLLLCDRCDAEYHTYCLSPPLPRIPKSSWYCPPCIMFITSQSQNTSQQEDFDITLLNQPIEKKRSQRECARNGLKALADLADNMESMEYWELGVKERVSLLHFLCDEALGLTVIREQIDADNCVTRRNFLGRDSAGRLYWTLGGPERMFVSGPHSEGEVSDNSSNEFDSWSCYESDTEIKSLVEWLRDNDARERELKESIKTWQNGKSNNHNGQVDFHVDCIRTSVYGTNARAELEKKFGLFGEGRIVCQWGIYRCDCLELVGSSRHHCFSCHLTFFTNEVHQCNGSEKQLTLTNGLVRSNGNPSFFIPEHHLQNTNAAFFVKQGVNSNESSFGVDRSNPEGITGKKLASFGPTGNPSFVPVDQLHGITGKDPASSSGPLMGRASEIIRCLKIILLDIETALPREAFRPSRVEDSKLRIWREYLKSAQSIYEMVQAIIILEDMIKTHHLKKEWWYWSSPSAVAKISTVQSLALQVYALDAAIVYEKPHPPPSPPLATPAPMAELIEMVVAEDCKSKAETPMKPKLKKNLKVNDLEGFKTSKSKDTHQKRKKLKVSND